MPEQGPRQPLYIPPHKLQTPSPAPTASNWRQSGPTPPSTPPPWAPPHRPLTPPTPPRAETSTPSRSKAGRPRQRKRFTQNGKAATKRPYVLPTAPTTLSLPERSWRDGPREGRICRLRNDNGLKDWICTDNVDETTLAKLAEGPIIVVQHDRAKQKLAFYPMLADSVDCFDYPEKGDADARGGNEEEKTDDPPPITLGLVYKSNQIQVHCRVNLTRKFWVDTKAVELYLDQGGSVVDIEKLDLEAIVTTADKVVPGRSKESWVSRTQGRFITAQFRPGQLVPGTVAMLAAKPEVVGSMLHQQVDKEKFFGRPVLVTEIHDEDGSASFLPITTFGGSTMKNREDALKNQVLRERFMVFYHADGKGGPFKLIYYDFKSSMLPELSWLKIETTFRVEQKYLHRNIFDYVPVDIRISEESLALIHQENRRVEGSRKVCREAKGPNLNAWIPGDIARFASNPAPDSVLHDQIPTEDRHRHLDKPILIMGEKDGVIQAFRVCLFGNKDVASSYEGPDGLLGRIRHLAIEGDYTFSHDNTPLLELRSDSLQMPQRAYVKVDQLWGVEAKNTRLWSEQPVRLTDSALEKIKSWRKMHKTALRPIHTSALPDSFDDVFEQPCE
ncbi:hypothetical protein BU16DRAFT_543090 [Lophium mytilinum]|uniref:Uncharacterized protein n=1 Tax=Lophium mytilinum TaxID=390894 RepID=A0A6A6QH66_9PEZI|nr:hypothetical protein BU16DRAFT_543090 [Lophium mytilinum]